LPGRPSALPVAGGLVGAGKTRAATATYPRFGGDEQPLAVLRGVLRGRLPAVVDQVRDPCDGAKNQAGRITMTGCSHLLPTVL
jgi:hypothetical protein